MAQLATYTGAYAEPIVVTCLVIASLLVCLSNHASGMTFLAL